MSVVYTRCRILNLLGKSRRTCRSWKTRERTRENIQWKFLSLLKSRPIWLKNVKFTMWKSYLHFHQFAGDAISCSNINRFVGKFKRTFKEMLVIQPVTLQAGLFLKFGMWKSYLYYIFISLQGMPFCIQT